MNRVVVKRTPRRSGYLLLLLIVLVCLEGCARAPKKTFFQENFLPGLSVVILPNTGFGAITLSRQGSPGKIIWAEQRSMARQLGLRGQVQEFVFYRLGQEYRLVVVAPGTYHISGLYSSVSAYKRSLPSHSPKGAAKSRFGNVQVTKTPEKEEEVRKVFDETERIVRDIASYYVTAVVPLAERLARSDAVLTLKIEPDEILLLPGLDTEVDWAGNYCRRLNYGAFNAALDVLMLPFEFLDTALNILNPLEWDRAERVNGFETWEWDCPVEAVAFSFKAANLDHFQKNVTAEIFPSEFLTRVSSRDWQRGVFFDEKHEITKKDGWEKHRFLGLLQ